MNNDWLNIKTGAHQWGPGDTFSNSLDSNPRDFSISGTSSSSINATGYDLNLHTTLSWNCPGEGDFIVAAISRIEMIGSAITVSLPSISVA